MRKWITEKEIYPYGQLFTRSACFPVIEGSIYCRRTSDVQFYSLLQTFFLCLTFLPPKLNYTAFMRSCATPTLFLALWLRDWSTIQWKSLRHMFHEFVSGVSLYNSVRWFTQHLVCLRLLWRLFWLILMSDIHIAWLTQTECVFKCMNWEKKIFPSNAPWFWLVPH